MESSIQHNFGCAIRNLRESKGVSQEKLAGLCDLHRTYISDVELGKRNVSLENIEKIALALGVTVAELFQEVEKYAAI